MLHSLILQGPLDGQLTGYIAKGERATRGCEKLGKYL